MTDAARAIINARMRLADERRAFLAAAGWKEVCAPGGSRMWRKTFEGYGVCAGPDEFAFAIEVAARRK